MIWYVVARIGYSAAMALAATFVVFLITNFVPGDPVLMQLGDLAASDPRIVAEWRQRYGLDLPLHERYAIYLNGLIHGDLGNSIASQRPVLEDIKQYAPATVELGVCSFLLALAVGIPLGIMAAVKRDTWIDHLARLISLLGVAAPAFWVAFIALAIFYGWLGIAPGGGRFDEFAFPPPKVTGMLLADTLLAGDFAGFRIAAAHLVLPSVVLAMAVVGLITRTTRASMLESMGQDYVRMARAKGIKQWKVIIRHVWPNAVIPVVTLSGLAFANLLSGSVLVETIFSWPGLGRYVYNSTVYLDFPAIMAMTLIIAVTYLVVNLLVDISYPFLDPKLRP